MLAFLVSIGTIAGLLKLGANAIDGEVNTPADEAEEVATVTDGELTIELGDTPVFAYVKSTVTVTEDMPAGYTLKAYSENSTLTAEGTDKTISLVTIPEDGLENAGTLTTALTDNTWGLAVEEPTSQADEIYFSLPQTAEEAVTIATVEDMEAEGSDTVTVYYGVYITPDMPKGTYTGASVNYEVEDNSWATVTFDGNGLYFDGSESETTNVVRYTLGITDYTEEYSHTPNVNGEGTAESGLSYNTQTNEIITIPHASTLHVKYTYGGGYQYGQYLVAFGSFWQGSHPDYTPDNNYSYGVQNCGDSDVTDGKYYSNTGTKFTAECNIPGDTITFGYWTNGGGPMSYASDYGYYAVVTGYDEDGNIIYLQGNTPARGEYQAPAQALPYNLLGWNTDKDATSVLYSSAEDIERNAPLTPGETTTLYAIWQHATNITFDGNGADGGEGMPDRFVIAGNSTYLSDLSAYTKTDYVFVGWNTKADGSGTNYYNTTFTAPADKSENLTLYAQWAEPTVISFNGNGADGGSEMEDVSLAPGGGTNLCNSYQGSPAYTKTDYVFTGWNTEADGSGTSYGNCAWYIAPDEPVDITLYAQWSDCTTNYVCYKSNGADGETSMDSQWADSNSEITLYPSNFSYTNHGFAGWSEDTDASTKLTDSDSNNNPVIYGPNQTITTGDMSEGMALYAVWLSPAKDSNNEELTFQTENLLTTTLSDGTTLADKSNGYVTALKDERDDNVYAVAKLADGNYWMIENLRLDNTTGLTTTNTNNPLAVDNTVAIRNNDGNNYNHLSSSTNDWCEYDWEDESQMIDCTNQSYLNTDNTINPVEQGNPWDNTYSYGNYYNWYSATAGQGTWDKTSGNTVGDICPAGWQLPIGAETSANGSFSHLDVAIGGTGTDQWDEDESTAGTDASNRWRSFPNNFVYSGYWYGSSAGYRGNYGFYWSSAAYSTDYAYGLGLYSGGVAPVDIYNKNVGYSVRCLAPSE